MTASAFGSMDKTYSDVETKNRTEARIADHIDRKQ